MNDFYNPSSWPATGAPGQSAPARTELASIATGFNKLPTLTANGGKAVVINALGTAMSVTAAALVLAVAFTATGAGAITLTSTGATNVTLPTTGTLATLAGSETFTNKTLTNPTINAATISGTIAGAATFSGALTLSSALTYGGVTLSNSVTGTGSMVLATSPTLTTPNIGAATGTSLNIGSGAMTAGAGTFSGILSTTAQLKTTGNLLVNGSSDFGYAAFIDGTSTGEVAAFVRNQSSDSGARAAIKFQTSAATGKTWQAFARNDSFFIGVDAVADYLTVNASGMNGVLGATTPAAVSATLVSSTGLSVTGTSAPSSGSSVEIFYNSGANVGSVQVYDRTGAAYKALELKGLTVALSPNGAVVATASSTGLAVTGALSATGLVDISAASAGQIKFPATQNASSDANTLDDYEEGTFSPSVGGSATYTTQLGKYTKIGRVVYFQGEIEINNLGTGSTTTITLGTLPNAGATYFSTFSVGLFSGAASNVTWLGGYINSGANTIVLQSLLAAGAASGSNAIFANGTRVIFSGFYSE